MRLMRMAAAIALMLCAATAHADELVYKGTLGLVTYVKKNIQLQDTVTSGSTQYLRYTALEGAMQVPLDNVVEIRFVPFDLSEISVLKLVPDTVAVPLQVPALLSIPKSVTVSSVSALKSALLDNTVDEIVMTNGRYTVTSAASQGTNSLWIGSSYASRTRPVVVRAATRGGVTFDGNGSTSFGGMTFMGGAHHQTWDGFNFTNGNPTSTGVIVIGGYIGSTTDAAPVHDITMRYISIYGCGGVSKTANDPATDHGVYISYSSGGPYNVVFDNCTVDDRNHLGLSSAFHFYHSDAANGYMNAHEFTISNLTVRGTQQSFLLWDKTLKNITVTDAVIKGALVYAVRFESGGTNIVLKNIVSTASGDAGFYSSLGSSPAGVTFINDSWQ